MVSLFAEPTLASIVSLLAQLKLGFFEAYVLLWDSTRNLWLLSGDILICGSFPGINCPSFGSIEAYFSSRHTCFLGDPPIICGVSLL